MPKMLVRASDYRSTVSSESSVSVFSDVPKDSEYASYIRIAAKEGWMSGYLGGQFKPDEYITMQDAERAVLAMLGYTNEDFTGDQVHARSAKFQFLELGEGIDRESGEVLNKKGLHQPVLQPASDKAERLQYHLRKYSGMRAD